MSRLARKSVLRHSMLPGLEQATGHHNTLARALTEHAESEVEK